jgi:hypothetical protein
MAHLDTKQRIGVFSILMALYLLSILLGAVSLRGYENQTGLRDIMHFYHPVPRSPARHDAS